MHQQDGRLLGPHQSWRSRWPGPGLRAREMEPSVSLRGQGAAPSSVVGKWYQIRSSQQAGRGEPDIRRHPPQVQAISGDLVWREF